VNKKLIAMIMTAVMLFPVNSITALASNSGLEVQGSNSSISSSVSPLEEDKSQVNQETSPTTTNEIIQDKIEEGNYTIVEDSSVVEQSENKVTVESQTEQTRNEIKSDVGTNDNSSSGTANTQNLPAQATENPIVNNPIIVNPTEAVPAETSPATTTPATTSPATDTAASSQTTETKVEKPKGPKAVKSLKLKAENYNTISISWKASRGATKYIIYRATEENGTYEKVKSTKSTSYKQSKLACGQTYYYKVVPYKKSVAGYEKVIKGNTKPEKLSKLKASVDQTTIKLTWKKGKGASSYVIYRSNKKNSGFVQIDEVTTTKYYDRNLESGKTYYYKVYSSSNGVKASKVTCNAKITYQAGSNVAISGEMRAVWISYLDFSTLKDKNKSDFTRNVDAMYDQVLSNKLNTVFVHVRAFGDAIYPSSYYPWGNYITSNEDGPSYDPLAIMVEEAHKKGLSFHAWINPYRTADGGRVNPASSSAVKKIVGGVEEIVKNYNVDGIHFDDYFYLSTDGTSQEEKMENVNRMIGQVYDKIKSINSNVAFGISPAGNVEYAKSIGCDVEAWLSEGGYVDYICPQLYWSDDYVTKSGASTKMFSNTMKQWASINKNKTTMYAGLALYKAGVSLESAWGSDYGWGDATDNLYKQYKAAKAAGYSGYSLYRYGSFGISAAQEELDNLKKLVQ
jgi:uncharacterized lipoprotein YddW (UPF0748 family)